MPMEYKSSHNKGSVPKKGSVHKKGGGHKKPNGSVHKQMIKDLTQISKKGINMNSSTTMTKRKKK